MREQTQEPEYIPQPCPHQDDYLDCVRCSSGMHGGWNALRQTRQGIDWMDRDDAPTDARGREEVGR